MKYSLFGLLVLSGCAISSPTNIIDVTDKQVIIDSHGNECPEREMLIYPDRIEYYHPACGITRIVKVKPHILPAPKPICDKFQCSP